MDWLKRFPLENILVDVFLALCIFWIAPDFHIYVEDNLSKVIWFAAPLQCLAIFCLSIVKSSEVKPMFKIKLLDDIFNGIYVLSMILTFGSFLWFYLPALAIEKQTGIFPNVFLFSFIISLFGGLLAYFIPQDYFKKDNSENFEIRLLSAFGIFVYLFFTEHLLQVSVSIVKPPVSMILMVMMIAYFPIRFWLAVRDPFSKIDLFSGLFFFGLFFYTLI